MFMNNVHLLETDLRCLLHCSQCTTSTKCPSLSLAVSNQSKIDTWLNWTVLFNISYLPPSLHQVQLGLSKSTKSNSESIFRSFSPQSMKYPQKPHFFCCLTWEFWEYQLANKRGWLQLLIRGKHDTLVTWLHFLTMAKWVVGEKEKGGHFCSGFLGADY